MALFSILISLLQVHGGVYTALQMRLYIYSKVSQNFSRVVAPGRASWMPLARDVTGRGRADATGLAAGVEDMPK